MKIQRILKNYLIDVFLKIICFRSFFRKNWQFINNIAQQVVVNVESKLFVDYRMQSNRFGLVCRFEEESDFKIDN